MTKFEIVVPLEWGIETFSKIRDIIQSKCKEYAWAQHPIDELSSFEHWHIGCTLHSNFSADSLLKWFKDIPVIKFSDEIDFVNNPPIIDNATITSSSSSFVTYELDNPQSLIEIKNVPPCIYLGS